MGIRIVSKIKIKNKKSISASGVISHTEFKPIIMPGVYQSHHLNKVFTNDEVKQIVKIPHVKKLPSHFWDDNSVIIKYNDTGRRVSIKADNIDNPKKFLIEFQSQEYYKENLTPQHVPSDSKKYFDFLHDHYQIIKNGDMEIFPFHQILNGKETAFLGHNPKKDHNYWFIAPDAKTIDYLEYKFGNRKLRFVINSSQIENRLINHGIALNNQDAIDMGIDVGVIDARTQELLALTKIRLYNEDTNNKKNNIDPKFIQTIKKELKKHIK